MPTSQRTLERPSLPTRSPTRIASGNETSALYSQCDSTQSPMAPEAAGSKPAVRIIHALMTVSISE